MASEQIKDGSVGFLTSNGQVKNKKQNDEALKKIDSSRSSASSESTQNSDTVLEERSTSNALGVVRERFNADTNKVISGLNGDRAQLGAARKVVKEQIAVAKELKSAMKDGDQEKVEKLQSKFSDLQKERDNLVSEIETRNSERVTERRQTIALGNDVKGSVATKPVKLERSDIKTKSVSDINSFLDQAEKDLGSVKQQLRDVNTEREKVKSIVGDTRAQLDKLEESSIKSLSQAEEAVNEIAGKIKSGGLKEFESASLSNLNESASNRIISQLLN